MNSSEDSSPRQKGEFEAIPLEKFEVRIEVPPCLNCKNRTEITLKSKDPLLMLEMANLVLHKIKERYGVKANVWLLP